MLLIQTDMLQKQWFEMFPEHLNNPFFIAGESYAGIFIPTLASEIMKGMNNEFH